MDVPTQNLGVVAQYYRYIPKQNLHATLLMLRVLLYQHHIQTQMMMTMMKKIRWTVILLVVVVTSIIIPLHREYWRLRQSDYYKNSIRVKIHRHHPKNDDANTQTHRER
jgi:hypothetical protein